MASIKCPKCGLINWAESEKCRRCEAILAAVNNPSAGPNVAVPTGGYADLRFVEYEDEYTLLGEAIKSNSGSEVALGAFERFYGQLILTNRRIMFLSSGRASIDGADVVLSMFGTLGSLVNILTKPARDAVLTRDLDMSALARPSSWALGLVSITKCEVGGTWYNGPFLRVEGIAQRRSRTYVLYGPDLTLDDLEDRKARLEKSISDTKKANESELSDLKTVSRFADGHKIN